MNTEIKDELRELIRTKIRAGYDGVDELVPDASSRLSRLEPMSVQRSSPPA